MKCGTILPGRYDPIISNEHKAPPTQQDFGPSDRISEGEMFDDLSYSTMELGHLKDLLDNCRLELGRIALQRAIAHPPANVNDTVARQQALEELDQNESLKRDVEKLVTDTAPIEVGVFELMWAKFSGLMGGDTTGQFICNGYGYRQFKRVRKILGDLEAFGEAGQTGHDIKSPYLKGLLGDFAALKTSRAAKFVRGPAYVTEGSPVLKSEKSWYRPSYKFRPTLFKPLLLLMFFLVPYILHHIFSIFFTGSYYEGGNNVYPILGMLMIFGIIPITVAYIVLIGSHERDRFMKPVGGELANDVIVHRALDALGEFEVLLAHLSFKASYPSATSLPEMIASDHHIFEAKGLKNPIIGMDEPEYIANDVHFDQGRLSFITGPNSGGKTALCKTICQNQVLAQMGGYVTAEHARISNAAQIFYQVPQAGELSRGEGRFATELARTRDIFFHATKDALVVLDEPFEGTSFEERLETSEQVLDGFIKLDATVLFITHNHALAQLYRDKDGGKITQFLEASFENDRPTHRFKSGIASTSHAARIADEIGFGREDIERRFETEGR